MSSLHWFEIPVLEITRAAAFYETVLGQPIRVVDMRAQLGSMIGLLPSRGGVGGALVQNSQHGYVPSREGTLVYLVVADSLDDVAARIPAAGGAVVMPKTALGEEQSSGWVLWMLDSEGNRVGLFADS